MKPQITTTTPLANSNKSSKLTAGFLSLLLLSAAHAGLAQQKLPASAAKTSGIAATATPSGEEESSKPSNPGHEGVKIHGHWVLEVHNPDGKLAERREFNNSLVTNPGSFEQSTGDQLIAGLLSGALTSGDPAVAFISTPTGAMATGVDLSSLCIAVISNVTCDLFYTGSNALLNPANKEYSGTALLKDTTTAQAGLTSTVNFGVYTPATWVLQGNFTVPAARDIAAVEARVATCMPASDNSKIIFNGANTEPVLQQSTTGETADLSSAKCTSTTLSTDLVAPIALTYTVITNGTTSTPVPLKVVEGQIVTVIVTLSFS